MDSKIITNCIELEEFANLICADLKKALERPFLFDKSFKPSIIFRVPSNEDKPFITTAWMHAFLRLRTDIINTIETGIDRKLSPEEKNRIDIKVYVEKGSNVFEIILDVLEVFAKPAMEALKDMTVPQILSIVIPAVAAASAVSMFGIDRNSKRKINQDNLAAQLEIKKAENEKLAMELKSKELSDERKTIIEAKKLENENMQSVLDSIGKALKDSTKAEELLIKEIARIPDTKDGLTINGIQLANDDLYDIAKNEEKEEGEEPFITIDDYFYIESISFKKEENTVKLINPNYRFKPFTIPKDRFESEDWEKINNREALHLRFASKKRKDGTYDVPTLMEIIRDKEETK